MTVSNDWKAVALSLTADLSGLFPRALPHPADFRPGDSADISLIHYERYPLAISGKQRKGVCCSAQNAKSRIDHVRQALQLKFPMSQEIPTPTELADAVDFIRETDEKLITSFWKHQISMLKKMADSFQHSTEEWYHCVPPQLKNLPSRLHLVLIAHILQFLGRGGTRRLQQYIFGPPLIGRVAYPGVFPEKEPEITSPIPEADIRKGASERFASRAKHRVPLTDELWKEALDQVKAGRLDTRRQLKYKGDFADEPRYKLNVAFIFAVRQSEKVRACDDLRHSNTKLGAVAASPITLPTWGIVAQLCLLIADKPRDWGLAVNDRESAYNHHPLTPDHADLAAIALRSPDGGRLYGFMPRTQVFGSVASVMHYNIFSRMFVVVVVANRLLGIPVAGYVDDFAFVCP